MSRFYALDRLRALAVVSMVQGHTFSALLAEDALPRWLMQVHALAHGLTAPAFLLGAGLAFGLATYPRYELYSQIGDAFVARMRRYGALIVLGYALQLPGSSLLMAFRMRSQDLTPVFRVGPLHLIAFCLLVCQLGTLALRSPRLHAAAALALGILVTIAAPYVYAAEAGQGAGRVLGAWLDASSGSLFPIFPWAGFVFFGVALGGVLAQRNAELPRAAVWLLLGVLLAGSAYLMFRLGVRLSDPQWFWHASPLNVLFRVGLVLFVLGLLHRLPAPAPNSTGPGWTALLARHSLVAFVTHLLLLYGTPFSPSLHKHFALQLTAPEASAVFVAIMGLTLLAIGAWVALSAARRLELGWVRVLLTALGVLVLMR